MLLGRAERFENRLGCPAKLGIDDCLHPLRAGRPGNAHDRTMVDSPGSHRLGTDGKFGRSSIWLSLSGGGFRAAIFHYGCLKRLHEVGLLPHVYAFSATSGGSVVAALLSRHWRIGEGFRDDARGVYLDSVDWEGFERQLLSLVKRGIFAPVLSLVSAYILYGIGLIVWIAAGRGIGLLLIASGLLLHGWLACHLVREGAHRPSEMAQVWAHLDARFAEAEWARASVWRLLRMLLVPSYLRYQILNLRACEGQLLTTMHSPPQTYLTAVDLNSGREVVFTGGVIAPLDEYGARYLWEERAEDIMQMSGRIEIAQAVSASSAFPPLFRPVTIHKGKRVLGVFVDGGVFDNLALNVPKVFSVHIHAARGQRYDGQPGSISSFRESTSFILAMDGGKAPTAKNRSSWGRLRTALRLPEILVDQQAADALLSTLDLDRIAEMPTRIVGMNVGFPTESDPNDEELAKSAAAARTHFDAFSNEECAVIAYCGYAWTNAILPQLLTRYANTQWTTPHAFADILPEWCGAWDSSLDHLRRHLRYSHWRAGIIRSLLRRLR